MLFLTALVVAQATSAVSCDDICVRRRATFAVQAFTQASAHTTDPNIQICLAAWSKFDQRVAAVGRTGNYGRSPQFSPPCRQTAVAMTGDPRATGSINSAYHNYDTSQQMAMSTLGSTVSGNNTAAMSTLLGALLGGTGSLDDRPAYDASQFSRISDNAEQIFAKLQPAVEYRYLMALQNSIGLPPETPPDLSDNASSPPQSSGTSTTQRAENGDAQAQFSLGLQYLHGDGVPKDGVIAYKWLRLAAKGGVAAASTLADQLFARMSPAQRSQAEALLGAYRSEHGGI